MTRFFEEKHGFFHWIPPRFQNRAEIYLVLDYKKSCHMLTVKTKFHTWLNKQPHDKRHKPFIIQHSHKTKTRKNLLQKYNFQQVAD
jgi:hypothetical protein